MSSARDDPLRAAQQCLDRKRWGREREGE